MKTKAATHPGRGVALVTPTSEHVARQSIVNAVNGQVSNLNRTRLKLNCNTIG